MIGDIKVFNNNVIVTRAKVETFKIILPNGLKSLEKSEGTIKYISADAEELYDLHVGDYIAYGKYAGTIMYEAEGEETLYILDASSIIYQVLDKGVTV